MTTNAVKIDHDAILREARALRAEAIANMVRSAINFFRRKPMGNVAKA